MRGHSNGNCSGFLFGTAASQLFKCTHLLLVFDWSTAGKSKERRMNFCCCLVLSISETLLEVPGSLSNWSSNHYFFKAFTAEFISCHSQREKILITSENTFIRMGHHLWCFFFFFANSKALWDAKCLLQNYLTLFNALSD